jgi:hypothetical protein
VIRIAAAGALLALTAIVGSNAVIGNAASSARLTVIAADATMEFRTLNLNPGAFTLAAGGSRTWQNLKPGRYVVVQAPPLGMATQVGPNEWTIEGGTSIHCTDGTSSNEYHLEAGDDLTCTFTAP